jgi:hypothetical protein
MNMCLRVRQELKLRGGWTATVFPEVEEWLREDDHQDALDWVASHKKADRYHSVMDFLFVEVNPQYRSLCFRFYESPDSPVGIADRVYHRDRLLVFLQLAYAAYSKKHKLSWSEACCILNSL